VVVLARNHPHVPGTAQYLSTLQSLVSSKTLQTDIVYRMWIVTVWECLTVLASLDSVQVMTGQYVALTDNMGKNGTSPLCQLLL
jgi:hypothetical protein